MTHPSADEQTPLTETLESLRLRKTSGFLKTWRQQAVDSVLCSRSLWFRWEYKHVRDNWGPTRYVLSVSIAVSMTDTASGHGEARRRVNRKTSQGKWLGRGSWQVFAWWRRWGGTLQARRISMNKDKGGWIGVLSLSRGNNKDTTLFI